MLLSAFPQASLLPVSARAAGEDLPGPQDQLLGHRHGHGGAPVNIIHFTDLLILVWFGG